MKHFLLLALLAFTGCTTDSSVDDGKLRILRTWIQENPRSLDPAKVYSTSNSPIVLSVYETLYQYAYLSNRFEVSPLLAADMPQWSKDKLTVTIPLRRGIRFHDDPAVPSRELTAHDFVFAFKRLALPSIDSPGWWAFDGRVAGMKEFRERLSKAKKEELDKVFMEPLEGVRALDDSTLQLRLTKPYPQLLYVLTMPFTAPIPPEVVAKYADPSGELRDRHIGTGPFLLQSWEHGRRITLIRNPKPHPDFYPSKAELEYRDKGMLSDLGKTLPFLDRIYVSIVHDPKEAWADFLAGRYDISIIPQDYFTDVIENGTTFYPKYEQMGLKLNVSPGTSFFYLIFNMNDKVVGTSKYLRQAISCVLDREKMIARYTGGRGQKQTNLIPAGIPDRPVTTQPRYDVNLEKAKELLKRAGFPDGKKLPTLSLDMRGSDTLNRRIGEFIKSELAAVNINVDVAYNPLNTYFEKLRQGKIQMSFGGWAMDYPDPENILHLLYGPNKVPGPNDSNFNSPEYNALFQRMAVLDPGPTRAAVIAKMDEIVQEESPWVLGYYFNEYTVTQPWVRNFRASDMIFNKLKYLSVEPEIKKKHLKKK